MRISDWSSDVCSSDLPFHLMFLYFLVADDHRAFCGSLVALDEAREHLHAHAHLHRESDRARLEHLGAAAREFEHFLIGDIVELARARDDARVGGIAAVDVGVDVAAAVLARRRHGNGARSEEQTSELQSLMRISYAVFCLKKIKSKWQP